MFKKVSFLAILVMALTTMPFSAFARDCADIVTFAASQKWSFGHAVDDAFRDMAKPEEIKVEDDITTYKTYANDVYKQILKEANEQSKKELDEIIPDNADGFIECNGYRADYPNCRGKTLQQCSPKTYEACLAMDYRSNKLDAKEKAEEKYKQALVNKICNGSSALSAEENKAIETEKYIKANGTMPPATSTKPAPAKPTSAKVGGAGAGTAKVVKTPVETGGKGAYTAYDPQKASEENQASKSRAEINAQYTEDMRQPWVEAEAQEALELQPEHTTTAVAVYNGDDDNDSVVRAPYAAVNSTVANPDYEPPHEHIDPLKPDIDVPKAEAVSAELTKKDIEKLHANLPEEQAAKEACEKKEKGKWVVNGKTSTCVCPNQADGYFFDKNLKRCIYEDENGPIKCDDGYELSKDTKSCVPTKETKKQGKEAECTAKKGTYKAGSCWCNGIIMTSKMETCNAEEKKAAKAESKLEKSMEKDIGVLTKAFLSVVKSIVKKCEKDNGNFKDGECVIAQQNPEATETDDNNGNKNKRSKGGKRK